MIQLDPNNVRYDDGEATRTDEKRSEIAVALRQTEEEGDVASPQRIGGEFRIVQSHQSREPSSSCARWDLMRVVDSEISPVAHYALASDLVQTGS